MPNGQFPSSDQDPETWPGLCTHHMSSQTHSQGSSKPKLQCFDTDDELVDHFRALCKGRSLDAISRSCSHHTSTQLRACSPGWFIILDNESQFGGPLGHDRLYIEPRCPSCKERSSEGGYTWFFDECGGLAYLFYEDENGPDEIEIQERIRRLDIVALCKSCSE